MAAAPFTGRKFLVIIVSAFSVIIGVNLTMAYLAIGTFPGLDVKNSYVASQSFDRDRAAQIALGWDTSVEYRDGELLLTIQDKSGEPAGDVGRIDSIVGRATHVREDMVPEFQRRSGVYRAHVDLGKGKWELRLKATSLDGTGFKQRLDFFVKG
jgi:nitrogen fixation protein FixH